MTTYYVGSGGNNGNAGTSWGARRLTLTSIETLVAAGDTVYVGPGTYRETLTCGVSGSGGSPITYIGDYLGTNTNGAGGLVRITGSDNDQSATRANCISASSKNYRTFQGFQFDTVTAGNDLINAVSPQNWIIQNCVFMSTLQGGDAIDINGASQSACTIQNCIFWHSTSASSAIRINHSATVDNTSHLIQNCIFNQRGSAITLTRVGGVTAKNCVCTGNNTSMQVSIALSAGQTFTVNNCIFQCCSTALAGTATTEIQEDYNTFYGNVTDRTTTNTGANSKTYPALFDPRWALQLLYAGAGPSSEQQLITPFDLASFSQLVNVAGTSPTSTDMRGTAVQDAQREWGALEYDSTLRTKATATKQLAALGLGD